MTSPVSNTTPPPGRSSFFKSEAFLIFLSLCAIVGVNLALDAILIQKRLRYFTGGSNLPYYMIPYLQRAIYFSAALLYDLLFYGTAIIILTGFILPRKRWNPGQRQGVAAMGLLTLSVFCIAAKWQVFVYFGNKFNLPVLFELNANKLSNIFEYFSPWTFLSLFIPLITIFTLMTTFPLYLFRNRDYFVPGRKSRSFHIASLLSCWALMICGHFLICNYEALRQGLIRKNSFLIVDTVLARATDFDRDGYGPLSRPRDPDNFNSEIWPFAYDIPGNGIDENGLAGDLPRIDDEVINAGIRKILNPNGMNVILAVIETFRVDGVELELDGQAVAPFMKKLSTDFAYSSQTYSNYGITHRAIQTMFFGSLSYGEGDLTLHDEFRRNGYKTYVVSAQNETWGDTYQRVGMDRFSGYFDPRDLPRDLSSLSPFERLNKIGHFLDGADVNKQVTRFLDDAGKQPFFMFLNYQDLHFPYYNDAMKKVFIKEPHTEDLFFKPQNREAIRRQYGNAAHHLDGHIRELFDILKTRGIMEKTVVVITGDHPDSLYENGIIGHGWSLDEHQRRTPLIIVNGKGSFESPVDQMDIPMIILNSVEKNSDEPQVSFNTNPARKLFMIIGNLQNPREIAWITIDNLATFNFATRLFQPGKDQPWYRPEDIPAGELASFTSLIHRWESFHVVNRNHY